MGTTVLAAATAKAESDAIAARGLADVTGLAEHCLLAALPGALPTVMRVLADRAALDTDVAHLAQALPALVRSLRYGDVRGTGTAALTEVAAGLAERVFVGLPPACVSLDAEAAEEMRGHVDAVHGALGLLGDNHAAGTADCASGGGPCCGSCRHGTPSRGAARPGRTAAAGRGPAGAGGGRATHGARAVAGHTPAHAAAWIDGFVGGPGAGCSWSTTSGCSAWSTGG